MRSNIQLVRFAFQAQKRRFSELAKAETNASSAPATVKPSSPQVATITPEAKTSSGGSTFFQRFSSFLTGLGVGFGLSAYFIHQELVDSNAILQRDIQKLLEKK
ncbi:hypothetical protein EON65_44920 [archaeon]|nr:MAG: hypothetical protein EON65_44920 [archaeon]